MKVTKLPAEGDVTDAVQRLKYEIAFESNGHRYEAEKDEWVVVTWKYGPEGWDQISMREATSAEIEEAKGPVRWWQFLRKRARAKRLAGQLPVARMISDTAPG